MYCTLLFIWNLTIPLHIPELFIIQYYTIPINQLSHSFHLHLHISIIIPQLFLSSNDRRFQIHHILIDCVRLCIQLDVLPSCNIKDMT